jgi:hypothetical protein
VRPSLWPDCNIWSKKRRSDRELLDIGGQLVYSSGWGILEVQTRVNPCRNVHDPKMPGSMEDIQTSASFLAKILGNSSFCTKP